MFAGKAGAVKSFIRLAADRMDLSIQVKKCWTEKSNFLSLENSKVKLGSDKVKGKSNPFSSELPLLWHIEQLKISLAGTIDVLWL